MSLTRELIQDGIAEPKNEQALVKAFVLSHGTMEVYSLKESRKFYEEFLGLECVRHARPAIVVRLGLKFHRSEEHTSELQSPMYLVCRLLLEKKKTIMIVSQQ